MLVQQYYPIYGKETTLAIMQAWASAHKQVECKRRLRLYGTTSLAIWGSSSFIFVIATKKSKPLWLKDASSFAESNIAPAGTDIDVNKVKAVRLKGAT